MAAGHSEEDSAASKPPPQSQHMESTGVAGSQGSVSCPGSFASPLYTHYPRRYLKNSKSSFIGQIFSGLKKCKAMGR